MPLELPDLTPTKRKKMTAKRAMKIYLDAKGICCLCQTQIDGTRETWIIEHVLALADGGLDTESNMAPAHAKCAKKKTSKEATERAKHRRAAEKAHGADKAAAAFEGKAKMKGRGFQTNRNSPFKKKMDGSVVRRND